MRVAAISTSRADYGIYRPLLRKLDELGDEVVVLASGSHLSDAHGATLDEILADGVAVEAVPAPTDGDDVLAMARAAARAASGFAEALPRVGPDVVLVLGDRYEMHAAATSAALLQLPIAHLHGGEITEGAIDDQLRHSITKLAHLHFPATELSAHRIRAMGEEPWRVVVAGSLAVDEILAGAECTDDELGAAIPIPLDRAPVVLAFHPATLDAVGPADQVRPVLEALEDVDGPIVCTGPNVDAGGAVIREMLEAFAAGRDDVVLVPSLGAVRFRTLLRRARVLVGNSSAALIEAPSYGLPVVNVGGRQRGRERGPNVVDAPYDRAQIAAAIELATSADFRARLRGLENPYGDGNAATRIADALHEHRDRGVLLAKRWVDAGDER